MLEILRLCGLLGILFLINIACSTYYNMNVTDLKFDKGKFLNGIYKAIIIALSSVGLTFVFQQLPELSQAVGIEPKAIMMMAIVLYAGLSINSYKDALGVKGKIEEEEDK